MSNIEAQTPEDDDLDQSTVLENANGNPNAKIDAQIATWAAHRALMGDRAVTRDRNENAAEKKIEQKNK